VSIPVRTLPPKDAEILARTVVTRSVSNGCVECYGLRWRSDALRTWQIEQIGLGRKPEVSVRIDELDLSVVYVELLDNTRKTLRATSTQPKYTRHLSLFEHRRLKAALRERNLRDRLVHMQDEEAFALRLEFYAALGRADDPIAYRRLVEVRDRLAALRGPDPASTEPDEPSTPSVAPVKNVRRPPAAVKAGVPTPLTAYPPLASEAPASPTTVLGTPEASAEAPITLPRFKLKRSPL
jgi:putative transposase